MSATENRVTVAEFGSLPTSSPLLVPIPSSGTAQRLHVVAAGYLAELSAAVKGDLGLEVLIASGWRPHLWASWQAYADAMVAQYGSVEQGRLYRAFSSPHETGLAVDFGCGGLTPNSKTITWQKTTALWKWLDNRAHEFGFTPYLVEPWHWEARISLGAYRSGVADSTTVISPAPECSLGGVCESHEDDAAGMSI